MKKVHKKFEARLDQSFFCLAKPEESFEPVEDHQSNDELPEDHCHNDEAQTSSSRVTTKYCERFVQPVRRVPWTF